MQTSELTEAQRDAIRKLAAVYDGPFAPRRRAKSLGVEGKVLTALTRRGLADSWLDEECVRVYRLTARGFHAFRAMGGVA